jgi:hypothetical protein
MYPIKLTKPYINPFHITYLYREFKKGRWFHMPLKTIWIAIISYLAKAKVQELLTFDLSQVFDE